MQRPDNTEYAEFYSGYVSAIEGSDVLAVLERQPAELRQLIAGLSEDEGNYAYAEGKWTIKELLGHITDAERVFGYRLHRFSHGDPTPLSSFDQDIYVANGRAAARSFGSLIDEFAWLRKANMELIRAFTPDVWDLSGVASDAKVTVRALAFIMAGHVAHHAKIISERYLGSR